MNPPMGAPPPFPWPARLFSETVDRKWLSPSASGLTFSAPGSYIFLSRVRNAGRLLGFVSLSHAEHIEGAKISDQYSLPYRITARRHDVANTVAEFWAMDHERIRANAVIEAARYFDVPAADLTDEQIREQCCHMLYRTGIPTGFPSILMTLILEEERRQLATPFMSVLDISAGWGDRLISSFVLDANYVACDPNTKLQPMYERILQDFGHDPRARYRVVHPVPFEDWVPAANEVDFDFVFTSPPFFNLEIYCDEPTQSIVRYPTLDEWFDGFLCESLKKCASLLRRPRGKLLLHLCDVINFNDPAACVLLVQRVIDYCQWELGMDLLGHYAYASQRGEEKTTETQEILDEKNRTRIVQRKHVKSFANGFRCNGKGQILTQTIWVFAAPSEPI